MIDPFEQLGELTKMRNLPVQYTENLRGNATPYSERLARVIKSRCASSLLEGTNIGRPSYFTFNKRSRLEIETMVPGKSIDMLMTRTKGGNLFVFPLHTLALSADGTPIIEPNVQGSHSVVHVANESYDRYNLTQMKCNLAFTADKDNLVTVNGSNPVTVQEYILFDAIVVEFERLAALGC